MKQFLLILALFAGACFGQQGGNTAAIPAVTSDPTGNACSASQVVVYTPSGALFTCDNTGHFAAVGGGGGNGILLSHTVSVSSAQIIASAVTPVVLVPAVGGKTINPIAYSYTFTPLSQPYAGGGEAGAPMYWENNANAFTYFADSFVSLAGLVSPTYKYISGFYPNSTGAAPSAAIGKPFVFQPDAPESTFDAGPVLTIGIHAGSAGLLYMPGDVLNLVAGGDCSFTVSTIGAGGAVTGLTNSTPGTTCIHGSNLPTTGSGTGSGLTVDTTVHAGDGTLSVTIKYTLD